ncbi:AAA family ATPase [Anaerosphaera multitolerans]|uniref:Cytidylate kinase-like family protein n=1 Tax=Anaerosphaera multitolerans TaxID=2487351 RepID=A0A437S4I8_9FIRM|nr:cytidylate kinase-like family protein [Anaerosphaera multitolerans]RVU53929.1 cytidylate kinase-like family protein [Anaerosphaera multitolerans]
MKKKILTISREFGSGGRTIAKEVADKLGFAYYDNELVTKIAEESGFDPEYVLKSGEEVKFSNPFLYNISINTRMVHSQLSAENQLFVTQFNIIKRLAEEESCVIVGRCSDYILRNRDDCLNVHIHAPMDFRADRIVRVYGENDISPKKRINDKDKKRKTYYEYYTDRTWGDSKNFHICLDSSVIGIENSIDFLINAMQIDY